MWENIVGSDRPQMTIWRMRTACWITKVTKHTLTVCNAYCFSTVKIVARKDLNVTLYENTLLCVLVVKCWKRILFHRSNPVYPYVFTPNNLSTIQEYYNATKPAVLVLHGWTGSEISSFLRNITAVYLTRVRFADSL